MPAPSAYAVRVTVKYAAALQRPERLVDERAQPKLDGNGVLAVTWPEEAPRYQGFDFSRPDLQPNDSLPAPVSLSVTAHALGRRCPGFVIFRQNCSPQR
jgi:hypothetical protein